ncbi:MAG: hypothetical protein A2289_19600 [Deltaproteobacteria bacterium RIFOXYA12_FULL_58_15]|nr:MAG: hypothetical protein A2289_19600 [Deltaproteobacteria bacterium RIFOXYA12_FULL_58_15]
MVNSGVTSPKGLTMLCSLLASGCYLGSAKSISAGALTAGDGWELIAGVPEVRQTSQEDCGTAALDMVLGYWGRPITPDEVRGASLAAPEGGIKAAALRQLAHGQGLQAFLIEGRMSDLDRELGKNRPILVGVMKRYRQRVYPHYEVVVGMNRRKQRILTLDPAHGLRENSSEGFATEWTAAGHLALIVFP